MQKDVTRDAIAIRAGLDSRLIPNIYTEYTLGYLCQQYGKCQRKRNQIASVFDIAISNKVAVTFARLHSTVITNEISLLANCTARAKEKICWLRSSWSVFRAADPIRRVSAPKNNATAREIGDSRERNLVFKRRKTRFRVANFDGRKNR